MRVLQRNGFRTMPWKNGGGETTEIIVSPEGATMDDFDWRVSMARVAADGPFSIFPGIDRSLTVLEGVGITLHIVGRDAVSLTCSSGPFAFPADIATTGVLQQEPILDLNVMTRRGTCHADIRVVTGPTFTLSPARHAALLLVRGGAARCNRVSLADGDALLLEPHDEACLMAFDESTIGYAIAIH